MCSVGWRRGRRPSGSTTFCPACRHLQGGAGRRRGRNGPCTAGAGSGRMVSAAARATPATHGGKPADCDKEAGAVKLRVAPIWSPGCPRPHPMNSPSMCPFRACRQAADQLSPFLGQAFWHGTVSAHEPRRDGETRLGQLRHRARHGRRLHRPPEFWHGRDRPHVRGPGLSRGHHCPARLAKRRALQGAGQAQSVLGRDGGEHGLHDQPLHGRPQIRSDDAYTPGAEGNRRPDRAAIV